MHIGIAMVIVLIVAVAWPMVVNAMMRRNLLGLADSRKRYMAFALVPDAVLVVLLVLVFLGVR